jgi:hypothetical protein
MDRVWFVKLWGARWFCDDWVSKMDLRCAKLGHLLGAHSLFPYLSAELDYRASTRVLPFLTTQSS